MPRFMIERNIPEIGTSDRDALRGASANSNSVLSAMQSEGKSIQWEHSYTVQDKTFCVYLAESSAMIDEHAERSGFPASAVTELRPLTAPVTAEG